MLQELQRLVEQLYLERGYVAEVQTLLLGAMEEMGEIAQAILLTECEDFKPSARKRALDWADTCNTEHEVGDCITYLLALCNRLGIEPYFEWLEYGEEK